MAEVVKLGDYFVGQQIGLLGRFKIDVDPDDPDSGTLTNPVAPILTAAPPSGAPANYTDAVSVSTGVVKKVLDLTAAGTWWFTWTATSPKGVHQAYAVVNALNT